MNVGAVRGLLENKTAESAKGLLQSKPPQAVQARVFPIESLLGPNDTNFGNDVRGRWFRLLAHVILAMDTRTKKESVVYGRDLLACIAAGAESVQVTVMRVGLDMQMNELDRLLEAVKVVKGRHDYQRQA